MRTASWTIVLRSVQDSEGVLMDETDLQNILQERLDCFDHLFHATRPMCPSTLPIVPSIPTILDFLGRTEGLQREQKPEYLRHPKKL